jgi:sensor histidine kinase regulating citrate/malate metabolism
MVAPAAADALSNKDIARMLLQAERPAVAGKEPQQQEPGLAAVNRVVQRMHGAIDMLSRPGRGSRITLKLPARS